MNDQPQEPAAPPPPGPVPSTTEGKAQEPAAPPPPSPAPPTTDDKASGGMRALGVLLALVLLFGSAVMIVAAGEIADTPTAAEVTSGQELLPSDGKVFDGSEGKRSVTTALMYASGIVGAVGVVLGFAFVITGRRGRLFIQATVAAVILAGIALIL